LRLTVIIFFYLRLFINRHFLLAIDREESFISLINEHQGLIHKICILYENDPEVRNDLFQEIVLQLWKSFSSFRGESKISTWMYRIALNTAISGFRKQTRLVKTEDLRELHLNISDAYADDQEESFQKLQWAIRQLSEIERGMIMMALEEIPYPSLPRQSRTPRAGPGGPRPKAEGPGRGATPSCRRTRSSGSGSWRRTIV
jgi:RNA polymerase sigma-70 factor (ECF subfamily)